MDFVETHFLQFGLQKKVARGPKVLILQSQNGAQRCGLGIL